MEPHDSISVCAASEAGALRICVGRIPILLSALSDLRLARAVASCLVRFARSRWPSAQTLAEAPSLASRSLDRRSRESELHCDFSLEGRLLETSFPLGSCKPPALPPDALLPGPSRRLLQPNGAVSRHLEGVFFVSVLRFLGTKFRARSWTRRPCSDLG